MKHGCAFSLVYAGGLQIVGRLLDHGLLQESSRWQDGSATVSSQLAVSRCCTRWRGGQIPGHAAEVAFEYGLSAVEHPCLGFDRKLRLLSYLLRGL